VSAVRTRLPAGLLAVLGALSAFGPLSTDMYLPGLPAMARDLHAAPSLAQLTLSLSLIGLAAGQLLAGPLSDARGRRGPMLAGLVAYVAASIACAAAPGIALLLVMRLIQGLAGACGIAIGRAVVRDRAAGVAAARAYAALMVLGGLGPILAPIAGGLLLHVTDWRGIFVALAVIGALLLLAAGLLVPESLPEGERRTGGLAAVGEAFRVLLRDRHYVAHTLAGALGFGTLMAYIAASPFVLEHIHHLSAGTFSLVFAANGVGILLARQLAAAVLREHPPAPVLRGALAVQGAAASALFIVTAAGLGLWPLLVCLFASAASVGAILPMATALAMEDHPERAGAASGVLGFAQFMLGAGVAPLVGIAGPGSALPMAIAMPACSLAASAALSLA
jgi:DHA1 family bicyclomycin/chloramphenicol resistance-like MFS transporter